MDKLNWTTRECFSVVEQLRQAGQVAHASGQALQAQARKYVDAMTSRAREAGYSHAEIQWMSYALVALMDEIVMAQPGPLRDAWAAAPLQMQYFRENTAGENFFVHLEAIRKSGTSPDVLRVYYLCMLLGFQGRYRVRGGASALFELIGAVGREVASHYRAPEQLSPYGLAREAPLRRVARDLPFGWVGVGACVLVVLLYLALQVSLHESVRNLAQLAQN